MPFDYKNTSYHNHAVKPVLSSRSVCGASDPSLWELRQYDDEYSSVIKAGVKGKFASFIKTERDGRGVMRLTSAVMSGPEKRNRGGVWGAAELVRLYGGEDWTDGNRLSFEVYPDLPGFRTVSMCVFVYNDGEIKLPNDEQREGSHFFLLKNREWNKCEWEFPELVLDKITGVGFKYIMQGAEPGACRTVQYDIANIRLEKTDADRVKGWMPKDGEITFCHTGYMPDSAKTAVAKGLVSDGFQIVRECDGSVMFTGAVKTEETHIGTHQILDFSGFKEEGRYHIKAGDRITKAFSISQNLWNPVIEKVINSFFCLRCGFPVPGIHDICHQDILMRHGGQTKTANGGWHDAGDLSQSVVNTSEAAYAMMSLSLKTKDPRLAELLYEEARWGQEWVLKTRFKDGFRPRFITLDYWSDGILGTMDDLTADAVRLPYSNFVCAEGEAGAARFFAGNDPQFARYNLIAAGEDFGFADEDAEGEITLDVHSRAATAALELYEATKNRNYLDRAVHYAKTITACQQRSLPGWEIPLRGFFYTTPEKTDIQHYSHYGNEQAPIAALCGLCRLLPEHGDYPEWMEGIKLYVEYIKKTTGFTAPYYMLPASVYSLETDTAPTDRMTSETIEAQIKQGIKLSKTHYLKLFPVWNGLTGNNGTVLSKARGVLECAVLLGDGELMEICRRQIEWVTGRNPFNQSLIWGEGYNNSPQYTATSGDITGTLPVGIKTQFNEDVPYYPHANYPTYKEVWVHPASRLLWLMEGMV